MDTAVALPRIFIQSYSMNVSDNISFALDALSVLCNATFGPLFGPVKPSFFLMRK